MTTDTNRSGNTRGVSRFSATQRFEASTVRVGILLSKRLPSPGGKLDIAELQQWLEGTLPNVSVQVEPDGPACSDGIARAVEDGGAERLVLGLSLDEAPLSELQAEARKASLDALGVQVVELNAHAVPWQPRPIATERAKLLLAAAVARARAFPGSRPVHLKASLSVGMSRRALFTLSAREYRAVPAVLPERCAADRGCQGCVNACPRHALRLTGNRIELDRSRCESCGLCVSVCPWDALDFPSQSVAELDAEISTLLDPALSTLEPRGLLFLCQRNRPILDGLVRRGFRYPAGWLPVVVPCTGTLSSGLLLRCLALGVAAVGVVACGDGCPFAQADAVADRVGCCRRLLEAIGAPAERIRLLPLSSDRSDSWELPDSVVQFNQKRETRNQKPVETGELPDSSVQSPSGDLSKIASNDPRSAAEAMLQLAQVYGAPADLVFPHALSPLGVIQIDPAGCTVCEACARMCPTGALAVARDHEGVAISFDATRCNACGACLPQCPEGARGVLRLLRVIDRPRIEAGRVVVLRDQVSTCAGCGAPLAPSAMLQRMQALLGSQYDDLAPAITRYCTDCRSVRSSPRANGQTAL